MNKQHISLVCVSLSCLVAQLAAEEGIDSKQVNEIAVDTQAISEVAPTGNLNDVETLNETLEFTISPVDSSNLFVLEKISEVQVLSDEDRNEKSSPEKASTGDTLASQTTFDLHLPYTFIAEQDTKQSSDEKDAPLTPIFCVIEDINLLSNSTIAAELELKTAQEIVAVIQEPVVAEEETRDAESKQNKAFGIVPALTTLAHNRVAKKQPSPSLIISQDLGVQDFGVTEQTSEIAVNDPDSNVVLVDEELVAIDTGLATTAMDDVLNHTIQFRGAAFFPASKRFREVYGHAGANYQIEASTKVNSSLEAWVNLDWYMRNHHIIQSCSSRVKIANFSLGLKYVHTFTDYLDGYLGLGPSLGWLSIHNRSWFMSQRRSRFALGAVFKGGLRLYVTKNLFLDLFADYLAERVHFNNHHVQIGGLKTGVGVGVRF